MYRIHVDSISQGMVLDQSIYTKSGALLLARGTSLEERHIPYLKNLGVEFIEVTTKFATRKNRDVIAKETAMADLVSLLTSKDTPKKDNRLRNDNDKSQKEKNTGGTIQEAQSAIPDEDEEFYILLREDSLQSVKEAVANYAHEGYYDLDTLSKVAQLFQSILSGRNELLNLLDVKSTDAFTHKHSINVAVLSVLAGMALGLSDDKLRVLALGALFHDIGKKKISPEVLYSEGVLEPEARRKMEEHAILGYETLTRDADIPEESALIALQHHERLNGSGYPMQLKGKDIHLFGQIVGIADVFEAMTSARNHRSGYNPVEIVEYLMGVSGSLFLDEVVKAMLRSITIYKMGTVVQLNNSECGVVIKANSNLPTRPVIRIVFDRNRLRVRKERIVDLSAPGNTTLCIVRSFG